MKAKNSMGFTLIELLAVIVIMGILLVVAIPAVNRMIENSRKDSLITIAKEYVNNVKNSWISDSLLCGGENKVSSSMDEGNYYILIDTETEEAEGLLEQGGRSPWGNRELKGYVRVNITTNAKKEKIMKYYIAITDGTHGIYDSVSAPIKAENLGRGDVITNLNEESNIRKKKSIMETPFQNRRVTTCSLHHGNWDGTFAEDSWETIISAVKSGNTENYHVGDIKMVDMENLGTRTVRIANKSTPSECSRAGFSQTACGFVLEFIDIITIHKMNSSATTSGGWPATAMRTYVNQDIYNAMPSELKNGIIDTFVISSHGSSDSANFVSTDKLYLLSSREVYGNTESSTDFSQTRQLDYYSNQKLEITSNRDEAIKQKNDSNYAWWMRSANSSTNDNFDTAGANGYWYYYNAINSTGVSPAFRIG